MEKFGLLGYPLGHSFSPELHGKLASYPYDLCPVDPNHLESVIRSGLYEGFNVTIPYKKTVMAFCDRISPEAERIGSVNTLLFKDDKLWGFNTDYYGFLGLVEKSGIKIAGKNCLVLGSGGASLTVQTALSDLGAESVTVISRKGPCNYGNLEQFRNAQVLVNTTPVGMYPNNGQSPVSLSDFPECQGVLDLIYNPFCTELVLQAQDLGIPAMGGLYMLVGQAKKAAELFSGSSIPDAKLDQVYEELMQEKLNLILIGMPGSGKTYIGTLAAQKMGRIFIDTDHLIEEKSGRNIPELFRLYGESGFRALETDVLRTVSKESGQVIATGGGIVTQEENFHLLKQNARVVWIRRDLDRLAKDGRPLSASKSAEQLYEERREAYSQLCDCEYKNEG